MTEGNGRIIEKLWRLDVRRPDGCSDSLGGFDPTVFLIAGFQSEAFRKINHCGKTAFQLRQSLHIPKFDVFAQNHSKCFRLKSSNQKHLMQQSQIQNISRDHQNTINIKN